MHTPPQPKPLHPKDWSWPFWFTVPLYPYGQRRTLQTEVVKDTVWTFDQVQGILYVAVPIRMTVVRLAAGGLLVYAPVAPTPECIWLMRQLEAAQGEVKYIILPTVSAIEHKAFVGPFARQFPQAQVFVAPNQWSFPLNLPLSWLGFPAHRTQILPADSRDTPFADEFDYALLGPIRLGIGAFAEVALFHKASCTLMVTDSLLSVPVEPPPIVQLDPYPLLFHARDSAHEPVVDTRENRRKGWQRISLFAFYFRPHALEVVNMGPSVQEAFAAPDRSKQAYFGWFPFRWQPHWHQSFLALQGEGRPFVAPILQTLILNRAPQTTLEWVHRVAEWKFQRIIPCHFEAPILDDGQQFRQAFSFLEGRSTSGATAPGSKFPLPEEDFDFLRSLEKRLRQWKIVPAVPDSITKP